MRQRLKDLLASKKLRVALLAVLLLLLVGTAVQQYFMRQHNPTTSSVSFVETHGLVPGNPQRAVEDLKYICQLLHTYQRLHGTLPYFDDKTHLMPLLLVDNDALHHRKDYGIPANDPFYIAKRLNNPDIRYDDLHPKLNPNSFNLPYICLLTRPDGTPVGGPKPPGTRDVLAWTTMYVHRNLHNAPPPVYYYTNPVGFYLVLWDDCSVEAIPYDKVFYVPDPYEKGSYQVAFPGEAGIPPGALSYDDYYRKVAHFKYPPHGSPKYKLGIAPNGSVQ
jgi:hypothetical protein